MSCMISEVTLGKIISFKRFFLLTLAEHLSPLSAYFLHFSSLWFIQPFGLGGKKQFIQVSNMYDLVSSLFWRLLLHDCFLILVEE